jgi:hypothetical protein
MGLGIAVCLVTMGITICWTGKPEAFASAIRYDLMQFRAWSRYAPLGLCAVPSKVARRPRAVVSERGRPRAPRTVWAPVSEATGRPRCRVSGRGEAPRTLTHYLPMAAISCMEPICPPKALRRPVQSGAQAEGGWERD